MKMCIRDRGTADLDALATLAALLWDSHSVPELRKEFAAVIELSLIHILPHDLVVK